MSKSLELLCSHAFKSQKPKEGYKVVSEKVVKYCDGHPLALKVLARSLYKRNVAYWEGCIKGLEKDTHSHIKMAMQMSYASLPFENDKDLFKHIACFFIGTNRDLTETILNACDLNATSGITNLTERCLVSIGWKNRLMMHKLVQEMGRDLVHQESPNTPWERSRLWRHEESLKVLEQKKGTGNLIGLTLDMRMLEDEKLSGSLQLKTEALRKMDNLKLLQLNYVKMIGSYKTISKELRWLSMHGFRFKSVPSDLPMEKLVVLDMPCSNIETFDMSYSSSQRLVNRLKGLNGLRSKDKRSLGSLKILNLSFCEKLRSLHGFFELPVLEMLIISNCTSLIDVSESIKHCVELVFIDLSNCAKLKRLPRSIGMLKKVKRILSSGCDISVFPIEIRDMDSLQMLKADNISKTSHTSSSASVEVIPRDMRAFMSSLPISLVHLSLRNNNLSNKSFPMDFSSLSMLKELYLDGNPIVSMPSCVRSLPRLEILSMEHCQMLETVEHPPSALRELQLGRLFSLRKIIFDPDMSPLGLRLGWPISAEPSFVIEGMFKIQPLVDVEDEVLCNLGWNDFEFIKDQQLKTSNRAEKHKTIQMHYEFGIFSIIYGGKEMPNWISCRSKGSSISFTITSSTNKLGGINICYVPETSNLNEVYYMPLIIINNITKNRTWIYNHCISDVSVAREGLVFLSHWMFGKSEMEDGDRLTILVANRSACDGGSIRECGVSLVYNNGRTKEDALGYYKSWNHIIGGDLSAFQTTTGEYILSYIFFFYDFEIFLNYRPFVAESARSKGDGICFRAFSQQMSDNFGDQSI